MRSSPVPLLGSAGLGDEETWEVGLDGRGTTGGCCLEAPCSWVASSDSSMGFLSLPVPSLVEKSPGGPEGPDTCDDGIRLSLLFGGMLELQPRHLLDPLLSARPDTRPHGFPG